MSRMRSWWSQTACAPAKLYDESNSAWTPSLELGHTKTTRSSTQKSAGRYQHGAMRRKHTAHINTTKILLELSISTDDVLVEEIPEQVEAVSEQVNNSSARESSVAADVERHSIPSTSNGDVILADQGFDITESVALLQATVEVPAFMEGKEQMSDVDDLKARNITNVQIHVERVIGLVYKRYTILGGPLPVDYAMKVDENRMSTVDKIAAVCCALTNLCPSVINVG
ncbi:hypothetical protein Pmani_003771 [Petrolisthes manimaculis]|uniref:DDE Tnp4 domain-containing protein n=1 Tax=Petrolisthes manimaculis TaxID=1843537 RepID=A0AAE1QHY0_9EUCA|nr:hypothetical protein Pmani_003771 [Petrolisthes manimaculis]